MYTEQQLDDAYQMGYQTGKEDADKACQHCRSVRISLLTGAITFVIWMMLSIAAEAQPSPNCDAVPDAAAVLVGSRHVNATMDFQESNPGLFLAFDCGQVSTRLGLFRNSLDDLSWAVTWQSDTLALNWQGINATVFAGFADYGDATPVKAMQIGDTGLIPIGGFEFTHDTLPVFVQWTPMPPNSDAAFDHLVAFGLTWDLK